MFASSMGGLRPVAELMTVNFALLAMWKQVELAAVEYEREGSRRGADLVLLSAGITDITVEGVLDPFEDSEKLIPLIEKVCRDRVGRLLDHIAANNPTAAVAVVGYFPMVSERSSARRVLNAWLDVADVPSFFQPFVNNPLVRAVYFRKLFKNAIKRSKTWVRESDRNLRLAVEQANASAGRRFAVFVPSPLTEENAAESPETMLFRMFKDGKVEDPLFRARTAECKTVYKRLEQATGLKHSPRRCSLAGAGHPNKVGARLYAEAIISELRDILPT